MEEEHFWWILILIGYETSIFAFGAPHEEVQGRQTKVYPGFTLGTCILV